MSSSFPTLSDPAFVTAMNLFPNTPLFEMPRTPFFA